MVVVYGIREKLNPIKARLSEVIHECMKSVLGLTEDKRAQRFIPLEITIKEQQPYQWGFRGMTGDEAMDLKYNVNV